MNATTAGWTNEATANAWHFLTDPVLPHDGFDGDQFDEQMSDLFGSVPNGPRFRRRLLDRIERFLRADHGHRFEGANWRELATAWADFFMDVMAEAA